MPKVSVCVPVYNVEQYIGRCLDSLLNQTLQDIEVVVVDDCSPDNSMKIVEEYAVRDARITIVHHKENSGPMVARHTGYVSAKGDYITFCDSDDYMPLDALETMYESALINNADIIVGNIDYIYADESKAPTKAYYSTMPDGQHDKKATLNALLSNSLKHNMCGKLFSRHLLQDYEYAAYKGCTNSEDMGAFYQIADNCTNVHIIDKVIYYYYQNTESSSQVRYSEKALRSMLTLRKLVMDVLSRHPELKSQTYKWLITNVATLYPRYNNGNFLTELLKEYDLWKYFTIKNILTHCGVLNGIKIIAKLYYPAK